MKRSRASEIFRALKKVEDDGCCLIVPDEHAEEGKLMFVDENHVTKVHLITCMQKACNKILKPAQCKKAIQAAIDEFKLGPRLSMFTEKHISVMLDDLVDHLFSDTFVIHDQQLHDKSLLVKGGKGSAHAPVKVGSALKTLTNRIFYFKFVELYGWKAKGIKPAITRTFSRICAAAVGAAEQNADKENLDENWDPESKLDTQNTEATSESKDNSTKNKLGKRKRSDPQIDNEAETEKPKKLKMTLRSRLKKLTQKSTENKRLKRGKTTTANIPTGLSKEDTKTFLTKLLTQQLDPSKIVVGGKLLKLIL